MDNGNVTALTLLNLSVAFDTIDHIILLRRLNEWFGVTGKALDWFKIRLIISINKLKLKPDNTEFLLIGNERQRSRYHSMFPIELFGVITYPAKSARSLGVMFDKNFNFLSHYLQFAVLVFTTFGVCGVFAVTFI